MNTKNLMNQFIEEENKLIHLLNDKEEDIQLLMSDGQQSIAVVDNTMLETFNLTIGFISMEKSVCVGIYANQSFSFPLNEEATLTRVWLDCRDVKDIRCHFISDGKYYKLSKKPDVKNDYLLIALLETPDFVQFSMYDGLLINNRISHTFTTVSHAKEKFKTIAYSMLNRSFAGLSEYIHQLEGEAFGKK
ncbi:hypothetical protein [Brevibacillus borstelensis]|uniref:hypothetical protein n=1 Tax=Brevibacillus borstelensis TaxID=45462 RepID=UPI002E22F07B|nr:hypothetical protein [Brevibacillus borstelensis]